MTEEINIFEKCKYWYYSDKRETGIMVSMGKEEDGTPIASICDKYGKIKPALQDIPFLIEMLERLIMDEMSMRKTI